jgi:hypothetical protein
LPEVYRHSRFLANLIKRHLPLEAPIRGAEVGVWKGETSRWLLTQCGNLSLTLVDQWSPEPFKLDRNKFSAMAKQNNRPDIWASWERDARKNLAEFGDRAQIVKADFRAAAKSIEAASLDFVFLDAAHSYQDTMRQMLDYTLRVRPGGLVCVHDYGYPEPGYKVVSEAVDDFLRYFELTPNLDPESWVAWWIAPQWSIQWERSK